MTKDIQLNARGRRINESHPRAKLTDHEVALIRELYDEGLGYKAIAKKFEVSRRQVQFIVTGRRRSQLPTRLRRGAT